MYILRFTISLFLCLLTTGIQAQSALSVSNTKQKDTTTYKTAYGLRIGVDISKPILGLTTEDYNGLELVVDYRIAKKWYLTTTFGQEQNTTDEKVINISLSGKYIKVGSNYNSFNNWMDMNNEIYFGLQYGYAIFDQKLNSYIPYNKIAYFPRTLIKPSNQIEKRNMQWLEFQLGTKVETFKNIFIGFHISYKTVTNDSKETKTLYAPGFNRVYENNTGFGFNYTISYLIPFYKK